MTTSSRRVLAVGYVAVVASLAAVAFSDPHRGFSWQEGAAMVLSLPALVPLLPVLYLVGAAAWNLTGADSGGPMWPVTVAYSLVFAGIAAANVVLVTALTAALARRHGGGTGRRRRRVGHDSR